ncbi:MCE family protein [Nonomuraea longicatena]|uniref:MCE family protein n=1 Tax=Nonomuraea longicatena TaxID=83682 RepID=A0ABP4BE86_9ACTN
MRYGLALLAVIAAFVAVTVGTYFKVFSSRTTVVLTTPRAGLQLGPRADVKSRGVVVGEVTSVRATEAGAELTLALDLPVDRAAAVSLLPKTLFGEKYVELTPPPRAMAPLRDGDRLRATAAAVEAGQVLDRLLPLLRAVRPDRLNTALTALATALEGRGERVGDVAERAERYLGRLEPHLPAIRRDLAKLADVTALYGDAAPDLLRTLASSADLGTVVTREEAAIDAMTRAVPDAAGKADRLLTDNETGLVGLQHVLREPLDLAARYSPTIPCVFQGLDRLQPLLDHAFGDGRVRAVLELVRPVPPYEPGVDRPAYRDTRGPRCYGLPHPPVPFPGVRFDDGASGLAELMLR